VVAVLHPSCLNLRALSSTRRVVASISAWFCVPEQGMKDMEILSRGSCFLLPRQDKDFKHSFHVLTASHIVSPWRWPKFYPDEWLQHLNEKHTHYTLELRHADGSFITQSELVPTTYHHDSRDVAVLHLEDEAEAMETLEALGLAALELTDGPPDEGARLMFHGHEVLGRVTEEADERKPLPRSVVGALQMRLPNQTFASTATLLTDGMCGGPVTSAVKSALGTSVDKAAGILEGIVGMESPAVDYRGLAVFLEAQDIAHFISEVEADVVKGVLCGGEAAQFVGADQDPDKMDWEKVLQAHSDKK